MLISGFSFANTKSAQILSEIQHIDSSYIVTGSDISGYVEMLDTTEYAYIVGIGDYTGRDSNKIRIETYCTNKFRNNFLEDCTREEIALFIPEVFDEKEFKIGNGMGNGFCNISCRKLIKKINRMKSSMQVIFFHIPKRHKIESAIYSINNILEQLKIDC